MNTSGIAAGPGAAASGGPSRGFASLLDDSPGSSTSGAAGPAGLGSVRPATQPPGAALPDDDGFLVVEDVSTVTTETGEQATVVSGEAVESAGMASLAAAEKGGAVILPLSGPRLQARSISGSVFASMLLDQRSGALPNPFSLWRLPEQPAGPGQASQSREAAATAPVEPASAPASAQREMPVASGGEDGLAMGREMSRLEAAISQLVLKLEQMLKSLRTLIGNLTRLYGGSPR